jgi:hypothetical protein
LPEETEEDKRKFRIPEIRIRYPHNMKHECQVHDVTFAI